MVGYALPRYGGETMSGQRATQAPEIMPQVERLMALGYVPLPTNGKVWQDKHDGQPLRGVDFAPDPDLTRRAFLSSPDAGLSVSAPFIRDSALRLVGVDVDVSDPDLAETTMLRVARIIGTPGPLKKGQKGGTFLCAFTGDINLTDAYMQRRGGKVKPIWTRGAGKIVGPRATIGNREQGIDLIGVAPYYHTLLPPTLHPATRAPYQWLPFPDTNVVRELADTPPSDLPFLSPAQLQLLSMCFNPGLQKVWDFIGATSPGDFNQRMVEATLTLHHEYFSQDEIMALAMREAQRDPPDAETLRQREASIRGAVLRLATKFPDRKPSTGKKPPKTPENREFAEWMLAELDLERLARFNGEPFKWDGHHWVPLGALRDDWYIKIQEAFAYADHKSTNAALLTAVQRMPNRDPAHSLELVPFANGVLDLETMALRLEQQDDNFVGYLPHAFIESATCPKWDTYLRDLLLPPETVDPQPGDHDKAIALVEEYLGYCLVRSHHYQKFMMLIGATGTGKSVLTQLLKGLLPKDWISEVALESFSEPNSLRRMVNSHLNISAEAGRLYFKSSIDALVLRTTSGEPIEVKTLFKDRVQVALPSRLLINGNLVPSFNDPTGALERRMLLIRTTDVRVDQPIPSYELKLLEEAEGILVKLVQAYRRLLKRNYFELPKYAIAEAAEITQNANSVSAWRFQDCLDVREDKSQWMPSSDLYVEYREWCERNGMKAFSSVEWGKMLVALGFPSQPVRRMDQVFRGRGLATIKEKEF
jgi:P4 family phage/plasmid primase-like protien